MRRETVVYKTVDGCVLRAEVHSPGPSSDGRALLWIHGGALILGSRQLGRGDELGRVHQDLLRLGCVLVSIDYRLAPETKLPDILTDLRDAYDWVRAEGPQRFGIAPDRIAVGGESAGGYLTLMSGLTLVPRPRALVSYYGYGSITEPWYTAPDAHYCQKPRVSEAEARATVGLRTLSEPPQHHRRGLFYRYCRQQGIWPREVTGHDPHREPAWFDPYCPVRQVTGDYPPTLLLHGTADTDVPYAESHRMAERLREAGVPHELVPLVGAGHGLEHADPGEHARADERVIEWIAAYG